jgi:hypothetical protein
MIDRGERAAPAPDLPRDGDAADRAVVQAHRDTILRHRRLNLPLAVWRDGRVVRVSPHDVPLPELPPLDPGSPG